MSTPPYPFEEVLGFSDLEDLLFAPNPGAAEDRCTAYATSVSWPCAVRQRPHRADPCPVYANHRPAMGPTPLPRRSHRQNDLPARKAA